MDVEPENKIIHVPDGPLPLSAGDLADALMAEMAGGRTPEHRQIAAALGYAERLTLSDGITAAAASLLARRGSTISGANLIVPPALWMSYSPAARLPVGASTTHLPERAAVLLMRSPDDEDVLVAAFAWTETGGRPGMCASMARLDLAALRTWRGSNDADAPRELVGMARFYVPPGLREEMAFMQGLAQIAGTTGDSTPEEVTARGHALATGETAFAIAVLALLESDLVELYEDETAEGKEENHEARTRTSRGPSAWLARHFNPAGGLWRPRWGNAVWTEPSERT